jgi:hypothetical protein
LQRAHLLFRQDASLRLAPYAMHKARKQRGAAFEMVENCLELQKRRGPRNEAYTTRILSEEWQFILWTAHHFSATIFPVNL